MIQLENLTFGYTRKKQFIRNMNLVLEKGSIYGLLGKNGAGKSTLLKNMIGLLFPDSGSIVVNGFTPKKRLPSFLQSIYFIPEEVSTPPLSVKRYLDLFACFYPRFSEPQCYQYLNELGIHGNAKLNMLSMGQQKKFVIAFALACNTQLLVMDEPTNGLDIPSKSHFRKLIASLVNDERMIIISTHQVRDLDNLIDKVVVIDDGEVLINASVPEITEKLCFKVVSEPVGSALYSEESLKGYAIVTSNIHQEESGINLEHFFNAITREPQTVKALFKK